MYPWLWRRLPGGRAGKLASLALIVAVAVTALWFLVFPWAAVHLPIDSVGVG